MTTTDGSQAPQAPAEPCVECGHTHMPEGCTGEPTPSDVWAGVSPSGCDCDAEQAPAEQEGQR